VIVPKPGDLLERLNHRLSESDPLELSFYGGDSRLEVGNFLREGDDGVVDARGNELAATAQERVQVREEAFRSHRCVDTELVQQAAHDVDARRATREPL
jgi:hypothetical protein